MEQQENAEKSISEQLSDILSRLTKDQLRFVVAVQEYNSKKDAAEAIGIKPDTVYRWNGDIDRAVQLMAMDLTETATQIRKRNLVKAMMIKVAGLDSDDELLRQKVATEIIEGELGKPSQRNELTGADGGAVHVTWRKFIEGDNA